MPQLLNDPYSSLLLYANSIFDLPQSFLYENTPKLINVLPHRASFVDDGKLHQHT